MKTLAGKFTLMGKLSPAHICLRATDSFCAYVIKDVIHDTYFVDAVHAPAPVYQLFLLDTEDAIRGVEHIMGCYAMFNDMFSGGEG